MQDDTEKLWAILIVCLCVIGYYLSKELVDYHMQAMTDKTVVTNEEVRDEQLESMRAEINKLEKMLGDTPTQWHDVSETGQDVENETE